MDGSDLIKLQRNMTRIKALRDDSECTHKQKNIVNNVTVGITCYRKGNQAKLRKLTVSSTVEAT